jgi:glycosyltransferase involved in cell wall biosynthesis
MKVGVFLEDFSPQVGGGYTIQGDIFESLVGLLPESRHSFAVICRDPNKLAPLVANNPIELIPFPGKTSERALAKVSRNLTALRNRRAAQTRLDEVARAHGIELIWFVGAEGMTVDVPYLAVVWDLQHRLQPWFPEVSANGQWDHRERFYAKFLRRAVFIIAGTDAGRNEIVNFYGIPAERIRILPHPTPRFALDPPTGDDDAVLKGYGLKPGYLFYPAQFWPHKNHINLLSAVNLLEEKYSVKLDVVFAGSDKGNGDYVRRMAGSLGLDGRVHFLGFVSQAELAALYRNALALAYVSFFGPENLPPLEGFALGCPVIAADVSGAREQLGKAALFVDPKHPENIAEAIKRVHDDAELRGTLIASGRQRAQAQAGDRFVRGVFSLLDEFEPIRRCWSD